MITNSYAQPARSLGEMLVPRQRLTLSIPVEPDQHVEIDVPRPMTEANWQQMMAVLEAMKPGLVRDEEMP